MIKNEIDNEMNMKGEEKNTFKKGKQKETLL